MSEIACRKCGKMMDSDLRKCPHCYPEVEPSNGRSRTEPHGDWFGITLVILGIIFITIGVIGGVLNTSFAIFMSGAISGLILLSLGKIIRMLTKLLFVAHERNPE